MLAALTALALIAVAAIAIAAAIDRASAAARIGKALEEVQRDRRQADWEAANDAIDRGLSLAGQGQVRHGLLWLVQGLRRSPDDASDLQSVARANLEAWSGRVARLRARLINEGTVIALAFSPDGRLLATGDDDGIVRIWDAGSGRPIAGPLRHAAGVPALAFSPDGRRLLTGCGDGTARIWDAASGEPIGKPIAHGAEVAAVAYDPGGRAFLTVSRDAPKDGRG